ncbi:hypothetical protein QR685DRAFT_436623 [Neurospora intermedia]|uniref:Uncharacterized protein n=1 Tax=Neurospora intermedia TaxID=5142 RepID=A0ABR3DJ51_NEUIN
MNCSGSNPETGAGYVRGTWGSSAQVYRDTRYYPTIFPGFPKMGWDKGQGRLITWTEDELR